MRKAMLGLAAVSLLAAGAGAVYAHGTASANVEVTTNHTSVKIVTHSHSNGVQAQKALYQTRLTGAQEVPAGTTKMGGWFKVRFYKNNDRANFHLFVRRGDDVTMAHLHCAAVGQNGPVVVTLLGEVPGGYDFNGTVLKSAIEDDNIAAAGAGCPTPVTDVETLKTAIDNDHIYINVHTVAHPGGEIRGQL